VHTEKKAGVSLLSIEGRADYALFYSKDPAFLKGPNDRFLYFWEQEKRFYPNR
jgi:hypothetical protein